MAGSHLVLYYLWIAWILLFLIDPIRGGPPIRDLSRY